MLESTDQIAFVGDSYCNDYEGNAEICNFLPFRKTSVFQNLCCKEICWPTEVTKTFGCQALPFGFGGKSWWYSRREFLQNYWFNEDFDKKRLKFIIFCHTSYTRINTTTLESNTSHGHSPADQSGVDFYFSKIWDNDFALWAREQWFREIARLFKGVRMIHLSCFDGYLGTVSEAWRMLPGVKVDDPLIYITVAQHTGTKSEINCSLSSAGLKNHLTTENNIALSKFLIDIMSDYPGDVHLNLPFERFDIKNPNFQNWPADDYSYRK